MSLRTSQLFPIAAAIALFAISIFAVRLPVRTCTSADGLGSGFVDYIYRDTRGFMWFCTRDGLSRFDGSKFVTFRIGDLNSPPDIENIFESREGTYFISTTTGVYRFDPAALAEPRGDSPYLYAEKVGGARGDIIEDHTRRCISVQEGYLSELTLMARLVSSGSNLDCRKIQNRRSLSLI